MIFMFEFIWQTLEIIIQFSLLSPFHHDMARSLVADEGDGLQIWRIAVNIFNQRSRTAEKKWPSSLGVGRDVTTHRKKEQLVTKCYTGLRTWTDSLERRRQRKMDMRFGTWNDGILNRAGSVGTLASEQEKYNVDPAAVQQVR